MTTSIQNLSTRQRGAPFSSVDNYFTLSSSQESQMCSKGWHHINKEIMSGFLRHSTVSLPERSHLQEQLVNQVHSSRTDSKLPNGGYDSHMDVAFCGSQGLVKPKMESAVNRQQVPRSWDSEMIPTYLQESMSCAEQMTNTAHAWSGNNECLFQDSKGDWKDCELPSSLAEIPCPEPSNVNMLQSSLSNYDDDDTSHSLRETSYTASRNEFAAEGGFEASSADASSSFRDLEKSQPTGLAPRCTRRRSLYRRRPWKKLESFYSDIQDANTQSSPFKSKCDESPCPDGIGPIVESPDWLPQGWLTEMKTRTSGTSAGSKYKCYVDPVTKRRFRTRKEVFCFIRTGNTGRYKPKSKAPQIEESLQSESRLSYPVPSYWSVLQGPNPTVGSYVNGTSFLERSWQYRTGRSAYGSMVNIQAAALKLLTDDDDMTLQEKARLFAKFSPRPLNFYGIRLPPKNLKKMKAHGREALEALGKMICQQGLSILKKM
ncbi:hypothetical protein KP509_32G024300 [Ceratopteris richardii]|uniref:MBD domain-containing protein n=1 Tax=Ceratopteris richardii TaxID=49495 RepID=A0A8T2QSF5_CERRI|nr:hypothetical protein KP509_32G024300 [Ceratopteris richardii]KAH7286836.1 hypothetical protein KP509_32G024300 [Ceratopteris richardii]